MDGMGEDPPAGDQLVVLERQLQLVEAAGVVAVEDQHLALEDGDSVEVEASDGLQLGEVLLEVSSMVQRKSDDKLLSVKQYHPVLQSI